MASTHWSQDLRSVFQKHGVDFDNLTLYHAHPNRYSFFFTETIARFKDGSREGICLSLQGKSVKKLTGLEERFGEPSINTIKGVWICYMKGESWTHECNNLLIHPAYFQETTQAQMEELKKQAQKNSTHPFLAEIQDRIDHLLSNTDPVFKLVGTGPYSTLAPVKTSPVQQLEDVPEPTRNTSPGDPPPATGWRSWFSSIANFVWWLLDKLRFWK